MKKIIISFLGVVVLICLGAVGYRLVSGKSLGFRAILFRVENTARAVFTHTQVVTNNKGDFTNVIFIHHSVGHNLIEQGNLREQLTSKGLSFWDQDYSYIGLTGPNGLPQGYTYDIPGDNTDIDGYASIFQQPVYGLPVNAFSALLQHEAIIFKSCFPNSQIENDDVLEQRKQEYLIIRQAIDQHADHVFFLVTSPPLNPAETDPASARRARELTDWLASPEFADGHSNLFVFNFFDLLAESDPAAADANMLRQAFRDGSDSHPNAAANQQIAPILVDFVSEKIEQYRKTYP